jgi:predicted HTH transcriptional regulator
LKLAVFATEHKTTFLDIARAEGNVFRLIDNAMGYIIRNIRWKRDKKGKKKMKSKWE